MNDTFTFSSHAEILSATWTKNHTMLSPTMFPPKASTADTGLSLTFRKLTVRSDSAVPISVKHRKLAAWQTETPLLQDTDESHLESYTEVTLLPPAEISRFSSKIQQVTHREKSPTHPSLCPGALVTDVTSLWQSPETKGPPPSVATLAAFKKNSISKKLDSLPEQNTELSESSQQVARSQIKFLGL